MCGRFALATPKPKIESYLGIDIPFNLTPRYNVAPTQDSLVLCGEDMLPLMMHWGFLPFWAKDTKIKEQINAKSETAAEKPMFRQAFKERRCIVITSGFFEWRTEIVGENTAKVPYYIFQKDGQPMLLAGIWDRHEIKKENQAGFAILTTAANSLVGRFHQRMPVILNKADISLWLEKKVNSVELADLFKPLPSKYLKATKVSTLVNSPRNDLPQCIQPTK